MLDISCALSHILSDHFFGLATAAATSHTEG